MFLLTQSTHRMLLRHDPHIGHRFVPNLRARIPGELGGFFVRTNAQGFRSDVDFAPQRGRRRRILFFGDSFTAGDGVDNAARFSDRVGEALDAEVFNYAVSGTGTDQQLLILERFAQGVEADLVVLCVFVENIERIQVASRESVDRFTRRRILVPKPYFTLEGGGLSLHNVPVPLDRPAVEEAAGTRFQRNQTITNPVRQFVIEPLKRYREHPVMRATRRALRERTPWLLPALVRSTGFQPHPDYRSSDTEGWRLMEAILRRFVEAARPRPVLIVPVPTYYFFHDALDPIYQPLFERLAEPSGQVAVGDLTRALTRLPWADRKRIPLRDDPHFSPFGHAQVARALAEQIRSLPSWTRRDEAKTAQSERAAAVPVVEVAPGTAGQTRKPVYVLGLSGFYHDSAAALVKDGEIVAAAEEERFSRIKNDRRFPALSANYCLEEAGIHPHHLSAVVYYDSAPLTFERLLHTLAAVGPQGRDGFRRMMPGWLRHKLHIPEIIRRELAYEGLVLHDSHHRSHAASAFFPSPFERAAIVTLDGVGEWAAGSIGVGQGREVRILEEMNFPHSLGLLYSAFTQFTGFKVNSGEYKMMGLAPYGEPRFAQTILEHVVDLKPDGSVELNLELFAFLAQPTMTNEAFARLFGGPARKPDARITRREMDIARSIQEVMEEAVLRTARHAHALTGEKRLCMAGGVALNCVANGQLLRRGPFEDLWIQPAAGDAGCALGAALDAYHLYFGKPRTLLESGRARQGGSTLGPSFSDDEIRAFLETHGVPHHRLDEADRADAIAAELESGKVVGHLQGRLEFGPRSLGARSILGDARNREMQVNLNLKIKYRESFRPFAPSVLAERARDYFDLDRESPFMLLVAPVKTSRRLPIAPVEESGDDLLEVVRRPRSDVPAITHVDYSARVQTVTRDDHPGYHALIEAFERRTGCAVVVNTSFNVRGEPIVCTPQDAFRCFMRTEMDVLVLGNTLVRKTEQATWPEPKGHIEEDEPESIAAPAADDPFQASLGRVFDTQMLPAIGRARAGEIRVSTEFRRVPSTWTAAAASLSDRSVFVLPPALDGLRRDPALMAAAIAKYWAKTPLSEDLRRMLETLLTLAESFPEPDARGFEEHVSHAMYVMY